jgi:hypothetical protein
VVQEKERLEGSDAEDGEHERFGGALRTLSWQQRGLGERADHALRPFVVETRVLGRLN